MKQVLTLRFSRLDGCHILPLADGSLGTLSLSSSSNEPLKTSYVASDKELKVFQFASKSLIHSDIGEKLAPIVDSGKFNVARLQLCHVKQLLNIRPDIPDSNTDKWLADFWTYWSGHVDSLLPSSDISTLPGKLLRAHRDGVLTYMTVQEFLQLPAVVEPSLGEHQQICEKIPGISRLDPKFLPRSVVDTEKSFTAKASFSRLMKVFRMGNFAIGHLDHTNLTVCTALPSDERRRHCDDSRPGHVHRLISVPLDPPGIDDSSYVKPSIK
jgi:sacsin